MGGASSVFSDFFFVSFFELSKRSHARTHLVFDLFTPIDCRTGRRGFIFTEGESGSNYRMLQGRIQAELPSCKIELLERLLKSLKKWKFCFGRSLQLFNVFMQREYV